MILRRLPDSRFSEVAPEWKGYCAVLIGGGSSLTMEQVRQAQVAHCAGLIRCIAINDAYLWAPWADVLYGADASWHNAHRLGTPKPMLRLSADQVRERFAAFEGQKCSIGSQIGNITDERTHVLRNARVAPNGQGMHDVGLSLESGALITGSNGGWQSLNLAVLAGANPILLLGYDARAGNDGRTHWSGGHQGSASGEAEWLAYRKSFSGGEASLKAAGVRVINCSPVTAIETFEKRPLMEALELCLSPTT